MTADLHAFATFHAARAVPGLPGWASDGTRHSEVFASSAEGSGAALALALAQGAAEEGDERPWLWVQDKSALRLTGQPYRPGLSAVLRHRLIHVAARTPEDALFALEEALRCRDLAFVIGELAGNPRALSFTASRRLSLVAEKHGVPLWLVRLDAKRDLSSARMRWQVRAAPSLPPRWNAQAPGVSGWHAELFRARGHPPGEWVLGLRDPLPGRGEDTQAWQLVCLAGVGEGFDMSSTPLQAPLAPDGASCAILSPQGERASA
jgi:protein ImuA